MLIIVFNWQYKWFVTNAIQNLNLKNLSTIENYIVLFVSTLRLGSGLTLGWVYNNMNSKIFAMVHLFRTFESIFARLDVISRNRTISRFSSRRYINKTTGLMKSIESKPNMISQYNTSILQFCNCKVWQFFLIMILVLTSHFITRFNKLQSDQIRNVIVMYFQSYYYFYKYLYGIYK